MKTIEIYPFEEVEFDAPLSIVLGLSRHVLAGLAAQAVLAKWTVSLEVDVAHLQSSHIMLTTPERPLSDRIDLHVPASAFAEISRTYSPDQLANIGVLHVNGSWETAEIVECRVVVDVFLSDEKQLKRRLYGVFPGRPEHNRPGVSASGGVQ